jgi:hypothetical protein
MRRHYSNYLKGIPLSKKSGTNIQKNSLEEIESVLKALKLKTEPKTRVC